jgi:hypothetical protein
MGVFVFQTCCVMGLWRRVGRKVRTLAARSRTGERRGGNFGSEQEVCVGDKRGKRVFFFYKFLK